MTTSQRGRVLRDTNVGPGLLSVDGKQYSFTLEDTWRSELPPRPGMIVDVVFNSEGAPEAVRVVPEGQVAKEQAEAKAKEAERKAKDKPDDQAKAAAADFDDADAQAKEQAAASLVDAQKKSGELAATVVARFGKTTLIAELLLIVSWFFLSFLSVRTDFMGKSVTLWQVLSYVGAGNPLVNIGGNSGAVGSGSSLYELLCVAALVGPLLPSLWKDRRAIFGDILPLAFLIGMAAMTAFSVHDAMPPASNRFAREMAEQTLDGILKSLSLGLGAYLSAVVSLYFGFKGIKAYLLGRAQV